MPELAVERIMTRLYQQLEQAEKEGFGMQCSAGIFIGSRRNSYSDFYAMADRALYAAKRTGKNKYHRKSPVYFWVTVVEQDFSLINIVRITG